MGSEVTIHFDPLIAKLICYGKDRNEAIELMRRALDDYQIFGVKTGIPFLREVIEHPAFREGIYDTGFIENVFDFDSFNSRRNGYFELISALAIFLHRNLKTKESKLYIQSDSKPKSGWKQRVSTYRR
mgnify:CR=1 FL=1